MAHRCQVERQYQSQTTPTQSLWKVVFDKLVGFFYNTYKFLKTAAEAANYLRAMLNDGRTIWALAVRYLL